MSTAAKTTRQRPVNPVRQLTRRIAKMCLDHSAVAMNGEQTAVSLNFRYYDSIPQTERVIFLSAPQYFPIAPCQKKLRLAIRLDGLYPGEWLLGVHQGNTFCAYLTIFCAGRIKLDLHWDRITVQPDPPDNFFTKEVLAAILETLESAFAPKKEVAELTTDRINSGLKKQKIRLRCPTCRKPYIVQSLAQLYVSPCCGAILTDDDEDE